MLAAQSGPLEVEQVGQAWFTSPALLAGAAILAAIVAAIVARMNHGAQLRHDRELHGEQLRHDRELRDLSYARESVNRAVESVADSVSAVSSLATAAWAASEAREYLDKARALSNKHLGTYQREDGTLRDTRSQAERAAIDAGLLEAETEVVKEEVVALRDLTTALATAREAQARAGTKMTDLLADNLRLRISVGKDEDIVIYQDALSKAFKAWVDELRPDDDGQYRMEGEPDVEVIPVGERMLELVDACQRWSVSNQAE